MNIIYELFILNLPVAITGCHIDKEYHIGYNEQFLFFKIINKKELTDSLIFFNRNKME
mgnify:CR=1 FL=1